MTSLLRSSIPLTGQTICYRKLAKPLPPGLADGDCISSPDSVVELVELWDESNDSQCKICLEQLVLGSGMPVKLKSCGHKYHLQCIRDAMKYQCSMKCPECRNSILANHSDHLKYLRGDSPSGQMNMQLDGSSCAGYEDCGSIIITYNMPSTNPNSMQAMSKRMFPNRTALGVPISWQRQKRVAYLPDNKEGNMLLSRLSTAFSCGITFTISKSLTTGLDNVVTWGSIHHKTSQNGGVASHGYPDDQYISNCNNELDAASIPPFDVCAAYNQTYIQTNPYHEDEKLLYILMHAKHCNNTSCNIIQDCKEFQDLYSHTLDCNEPSCTIERCNKARGVLDHLNKKPQLCMYVTNGSKCGTCGIVSAAIEGCKAADDSFGEIKPAELNSYVQLSLQSSRQRDDTLFFYQEKVKSVFTENMSGGNCLSGIQKQIESEGFLNFVELSHIEAPSITINTSIFRSDIYQAFVEEMKILCAESTEKEFNVQVVLHGTSESNIESILSNGLDPSLRRGQQYGQGEYFAASPDLPLRYYRGGTKMLVFLVITTDFDLRGQHDIVAVKKTQRQLPIATLSFLSYDPKALTAARTFQASVSKLVSEVREKEKAVKQAAAKEKIIRLILQGEYFAASDIYNISCDENGQPPKAWADEMAAYVRDHIRDEEQVEIYFPNLPKRPKSTLDLKIRATKDIEDEAASARKKLASVTAAKGTDTSSNDNENGRDASTNDVHQSSSSLSAGGRSSLKHNMFSPGQNNMPIPPRQQQQQQQQSRRSINGISSSNLKIRATTDIEAEAASARKKLRAAKGTDTSSNDNEKNGRDDTDATRHKRQRLLLLRHASKCTAENGLCPVTPNCAEMKA